MVTDVLYFFALLHYQLPISSLPAYTMPCFSPARPDHDSYCYLDPHLAVTTTPSSAIRFRPMNRMELELRSQECIDLNDEGTTVMMTNSASLGELRASDGSRSRDYRLWEGPSLADELVLNSWTRERWSVAAARRSSKLTVPGFAFDRVFDTDTRQDEIFDWGVKGIVEGMLVIL